MHKRQREALEAPESSVGDAMRSPAMAVGVESPLSDALGLFVQSRIGCVPVIREGVVAGMVTEVDILRAYADACRRGKIRPDDDPPISEHMTKNPTTLDGGLSGTEVADAMRKEGVRHFLIVEDGKVSGIVSDRDVRRVRGRGRLELTLARELMSPEPETAAPVTRLSSVALILSAERISALPIVSDGSLAGITTTIDVMIPCALALQRL